MARKRSHHCGKVKTPRTVRRIISRRSATRRFTTRRSTTQRKYLFQLILHRTTAPHFTTQHNTSQRNVYLTEGKYLYPATITPLKSQKHSRFWKHARSATRFPINTSKKSFEKTLTRSDITSAAPSCAWKKNTAQCFLAYVGWVGCDGKPVRSRT